MAPAGAQTSSGSGCAWQASAAGWSGWRSVWGHGGCTSSYSSVDSPRALAGCHSRRHVGFRPGNAEARRLTDG